jgi:hypothetical protein
MGFQVYPGHFAASRTRRIMSLEGSSTCADHTTTNKMRSGPPTTRVRSAAEQPRFRGSNRMLPTKGGRFTPIRARNAARAGPGWFRPRPRRRRPHSRRSTSSEVEKAPRLLAGLIARQAHSANLRPERINRARRRHADLTDQSGAAISFAAHAIVVVIDEETWNPIELGIALRREPRPIRRKRTARTASPAYRHPIIERVNGIEHHRPKHPAHRSPCCEPWRYGGDIRRKSVREPRQVFAALLAQGLIDHCRAGPGESASNTSSF